MVAAISPDGVWYLNIMVGWGIGELGKSTIPDLDPAGERIMETIYTPHV